MYKSLIFALFALLVSGFFGAMPFAVTAVSVTILIILLAIRQHSLCYCSRNAGWRGVSAGWGSICAVFGGRDGIGYGRFLRNSAPPSL
jgi:hypothetical protein